MGRIREMLRRDLEIMLRSVSELVKHNAERLHPTMENVFSDSDMTNSVAAAADAEAEVLKSLQARKTVAGAEHIPWQAENTENMFSDSDSVSAAAEAEVLEIICVLMLLYFYMYVLILLYILYICPLR